MPIYDPRKGQYDWYSCMLWINKEAILQLFLDIVSTRVGGWGGGCQKDREIDAHYEHLVDTTSCTLGFED